MLASYKLDLNNLILAKKGKYFIRAFFILCFIISNTLLPINSVDALLLSSTASLNYCAKRQGM